MARGEQVRITPRLWRKTSQWFAIERGLAQVIVDDTAVADLFRETCVEVDFDEELDRQATPLLIRHSPGDISARNAGHKMA